MFVDPEADQVAAFAAAAASDASPVFMLNLLRFKESADGVLGDEGISGADAYARYSAAVVPHLQRVGGELRWAGACTPALIGPDGEWDLVLVVRYPSRAAFLEMVSDPEYLEVSRLRTAALAESRLIPCAELAFG